jgi:hypothetical protein
MIVDDEQKKIEGVLEYVLYHLIAEKGFDIDFP